MKNSLAYENVVQEVKKAFFEINKLDISDINSNLYGTPFFLKPYDIMYVLMRVFRNMNLLSRKFSPGIVEQASFGTVASISEFLCAVQNIY